MPTDIEQVRKNLANLPATGYPIYRPKYGDSKEKKAVNQICLFSWPPQGGKLAIKVQKHFGLGTDGKAQEICPKTHGGNCPCPICDWVAHHSNSTEAPLVERAKKLRGATRYLQLVGDWDLLEKEQKRIIAVYDCAEMIHRKIMEIMASQNFDLTAWDTVLCELQGYSMGPGIPKRIDFAIAMEQMAPKKISRKPEEWLAVVPDLDAILKPASPERLQKYLDGVDPDDDAPTGESPAAGEHTDPDWSVKDPVVAATQQLVQAVIAQPQVTQPVTTPAQPRKSLSDLVRESKEKATAT